MSPRPLNVLYEDNHVIAVEKPVGTLVQGDTTGGRSGEVSLLDEVRDYLKTKYSKPGNVFVGLIHRLDRNVGGIVLFAKTSKGASRLSEQFRLHTVKKTYHAWIHGIPVRTRATFVNYLVHNEAKNIAQVFDEEVKGSSRAELAYEVVESRDNATLVKIMLMTGRHHQIRAQLSKIGHPIIGDVKYGSSQQLPNHEILLKATGLTFTRATPSEGDEKASDIALSLPSPRLS